MHAEPGHPAASRATLNVCDSVNTCHDHSGDVPAIATADSTPTTAATRIGLERGSGTRTSALACRTSRVDS